MKKEAKKIFVGISGGVDSSVVAYLLKNEGHDVHGVFVKTWSPEWLPCTWVDEKRDAMRVCAALDIPFHFLDAEVDYKKGVADYMIAEYKAGRTPNPDVLCNRVIKFGVMWDYVNSQCGEYIATGHYAQTDGGHLMKGVDASKDQSYFLWMLSKEDLSHTLFPIGHLQKEEVRKIAKRAGLFTSEKKDSQGICFLGDVDMREFLSHYIDQKKGTIMNTEGVETGEHDGIWFYTLGERHGFRLHKQTTDQKPYYIVEKNWNYDCFIVSSFDWNALQEIRSLNPNITIGVLTQTDLALAIGFADFIKAKSVHPYFHLLTHENSALMQQKGFQVFPWTVNELEDIQKIKSMHVDGIITDFPDRL